ncbi:MAG TPA: tetratricopeptide repeat protein [Polyangiaceae bacterium]|nr:tetratricopeptide repeat protein [Polyangiaceae bacterium]
MDDHVRQLLLLGREHFAKGEYDDAEALLRRVVDRAAGFADVHHMLGVIAHGRGDFGEAERRFERAVAVNPSYTEAQLNLMVTYNDLGKYEAARRVQAAISRRDAGAHVARDPFVLGRIANMHADVAQAYLDAGMVIEAITELERAVLLSGFADLRTRLGVLYRDTGAIARAREQFELAKAANPRFLQARIMLAVLMMVTGEPEAAIAELQAAAAIDPDDRSVQLYLRIARSRRPSEVAPP